MEDEEYEDVMNDITKAPSQWSVDEMVENLSKFHLNFYRKKFKQNQIDGKKFLKMEDFKEILEKDDSDTEELLKCMIKKKKYKLIYKGQRNLRKIEKDKFISKKSPSIKAQVKDEDGTIRFSSNKKKLRDMNVVESEFTNEENSKKNKESNKKSSPFKNLQRFDSGPIEKEEVENKDKNNKSNQDKNIKRMESGSEEEEEVSKDKKNMNKNSKSNQIKKIEQIESGSEQEEEIPNEKILNKKNLTQNKSNNDMNIENEPTLKIKKPKIENPAEDQTIKIKKKKRPEDSDDDEENKEMTKKIKKVIPLVLIKKGEEEKDYKIVKNCKIGRLENNDIRITDKEISKNHAEINLIDYNFYIRDNGSSNGTFIKLMEDSNLKITEDMCFDVGSHFLKILSLDFDNKSIEVGFSNEVDFDKIENFSASFGSKTQIIFGKKAPKSKLNPYIEFSKNNDLAEQHGVFTLNDNEEFEIRPLKSDNGIWLKLEMPDKSKYPFCRLIPNMQIKFGASHIYIVKEGNFSDLKSCKKCKNIRNSVNLDCLHSIYCFDCAKEKFKKKEKKCLECKKDIESIQEIINIKNK